MATYNNIKKIKIGDNIFNLYDSGNSGGTITSVKTTAGTHSAIDVSSGAVSFNVPTKTSHLTNDSGFITASHTSTYSLPLAASGTRGGVQIGYSESGTNYAVKLSSEKMYVTVPWTDTKVTTAALISGDTYYPILATGTGTATRQIDSTLGGLKYRSFAGSTSGIGMAELTLGNQIASGTANNERGLLRLYGTTAYYCSITIENEQPTANRTIFLPSYAGNMYLTCTSTTDAVGDSTVPVYVDNTGRIQPVDSIAIGLIEKPFMKAHGSSTQITLSEGVITQVPLTTVDFSTEYSGITLESGHSTIAVNPGIYRVTASLYMAPGSAGAHGVYIRMGTTDIAFANATEVASTYEYTTGSGSLNTTVTVKANDVSYIWLAARGTANTKVTLNNPATYLEVEKIASVY